MIAVTARLGDGATEIRVEGHADSTVCAAVSAITQTCLLGLHAVAAQNPDDVSITITEEKL